MRKESIKSLEFDKVLDIISAYCHSGISKDKALAIRPLGNIEDIEKRSGQIAGIRRLRAEGSPLGFQPFADVSHFIEKTRPEGSMLEPIELAAFIPVLEMLGELSSLLSGRGGFLGELAFGLTGFPEILHRIERSVDSEGNILDTASPALYELRAEKRKLETKIRKKLEDIIRDRNIAPFVQDVFVSQRSGRWVIPVRMDSKGHVPGLVHDVSRTGETAFMEPLEVIGLSNEFEALVAEEKAEEIRIIKYITSKIRAEAGEINRQFEILVKLDVLNSIAGFADRLSMEAPEINDGNRLVLKGAMHPLLIIQRGNNAVVPLGMSLDRGTPLMIITGPNAGGKTIAIKTAGLLLLMALSGMPVPADSSSTFPFLDKLLVDIGDEQSIESSLSTFSAHISNISGIIKEAGPRSLVLMDELGTGTDPEEGAAISCAVLSDIKKKGGFALATTHLLDIVAFVHRSEGMVNASMEFDSETHTPLYRLKSGEPGSSHALDIAEKYGMPQEILKSARSMLGTMKAELESLIQDLREKREQHERAAADAEKLMNEYNSKNALLSERLSAIDREKKEAFRKAYEEAGEVIISARREVHEIMDAAKKTKKTKDALKKLSEAHIALEGRMKEEFPEAAPLFSINDLKAGDMVYVKSLGSDAKIIEIDIKNDRLKVQAGKISADVPASSVGPASKTRPGSPAAYFAPSGREAARSLDIRGMRVDEAMPLIERLLNDASLGGLDSVTIIHGIGTGILMKAVREHLDGHPLVGQMRKGEQQEGGEGATIVVLK